VRIMRRTISDTAAWAGLGSGQRPKLRMKKTWADTARSEAATTTWKAGKHI